MRRWSTIRQRRFRHRKGQVSAVATILGLLLIVAFIANFIIAELPGNMDQVETAHILQVENQLGRLQATIDAEAQSPNTQVALASPLTLGSAADPPFGLAATSVVETELAGVGTVATYQSADVVSPPITWNSGSACLAGGHGTCGTAGAKNTYNYAGNHTALAVTISGSGDSLFYNLTGTNDTLTITWSGTNAVGGTVVANGTNNSVVFKKTTTDTGSPTFHFSLYGAKDKFTLTPTGSHSGPGGTKVTVALVGSYDQICPWGNLTATDSLGAFATGGTFVNETVTRWDAVGYVTPAQSHVYASGTVTYQNQTGYVGCAFTKTDSSAVTVQEAGGLLVDLQNRYVAPTFVAFDQGAVVAQESGGGSVMVDPPQITITARPAGTIGNVTFLNLVMNKSSEAGLSTASVMTQILSVSHYSIVASATHAISSPIQLSIRTLFPAAWWSYFQSLPTAFPYGASCVTIEPVSSPATCLDPPAGTAEQILAPMDVQSLIVTDITAKLWID
jgi:hypothetical protein